ncbi:hypothetical protein MP228_009944 [Amoeboaphelidium protococcarum]|nr:hypothetical protein MP228_009944 [Amoeboaphelidium protococcarum]
MALRLHPDKNQAVDTDQFNACQRAWEVLRDDDSRRQYDMELQLKRAQTSVNALIYESIEISEMDVVNGRHEYLCRCGGTYSIGHSDVPTDTQSLLVECDNCSFHLQIACNQNP